MASNLEVIISATDRFTGTANRVIGTLGRMDTAAGRVGKGVGQLGIGFARVGVIAGAAAVGGLAAIAKASVNWETALAGVNKTMDVTPAQLQEIGGQIRSLATNIPLSATAIAGLVEQAGALGIAKENVVEFARVAATIGVTTNVSADQAATSLGVMANLLKLTGEDYERFASSLVDLGNKGASTEAGIIAIAERAAGAGATIGLTTDQILGFASAVANLGIEPEAGGSSLQRAFIDTAKLISKGGDDLKVFAATAGMTGKQVRKMFEEDAAGTLEKFVDGLAELSTDDRLKVLDALGWDDVRIGRMFLGLAEAEKNQDNLSRSLNISAEAWKSNTAAAEEADKRYGSVASKLSLLKNQAIEGALVIGEGFLPALGRTADKLKAILADPAARSDLRKLGTDLGAMLDGIDWRKVIEGAKTFLSVIQTAFTVLSKIPAEITAAVVGFVGLNKLSGGLISAGVSNIAGGLMSGLSRGVAAKVPGIGGLFAQPVYVTNWPMGGIGGGMGGPLAGVGQQSRLSMALGTLPVLMAAAIPIAIGAGLGELTNQAARNDPQLQNAVIVRERAAAEDKVLPGARGGPQTVMPVRVTNQPKSGGMSPDERAEYNATQARIAATTRAMNAQGSRITAAINRLDMRVVVPVTVRVFGNTISRATGTTLVRLGSGAAGTGAARGM